MRKAGGFLQIANIGPADWNYDETMSTLRYANRAKNIKNKPVVNEDPKDAMLRDMEKEMAQLRARLAGDGAAEVCRPNCIMKSCSRAATCTGVISYSFRLTERHAAGHAIERCNRLWGEPCLCAGSSSWRQGRGY